MRDTKELIEIVSNFKNQHGYIPLFSELVERKLCCKRDFNEQGGYKNFVVCNFPLDTRHHKHTGSSTSKERIRDEILSIINPSNGITVRKLQKMNKLGEFSFSRFQVEKVFGTWEEFLLYCGITKSKDFLSDYSKEEIRCAFIDFYHEDIPTIERLNNDYNKGSFIFNQGMIKSKFGSYTKFLQFCKVSIRSSSWFNNHCLSKDGDMCNSYSERIVDDFFFDNGIFHRKEVYYKDLKIKTRRKYRTDWVLEDGFVVEFCGMLKTKDYADKMRDKQRLLEENNINFIFLDYNHLDILKEIFSNYMTREEVS